MPPLDFDPKKMLARGREAEKRLTLLAGVYRITRDPKYADQARREMLALCSFPNWQPDDFLATAETMFAVATAYDWTYDALPPQDRQRIADGLARNGLQASADSYRDHAGWTYAKHNWNVVCNSATIVASLALIDEQPRLARANLANAFRSIRNGLGGFDPAGGTPEGPMYHTYATRYLTFAAAALETAAGSDAALEQISTNWTHAGDYRIATCGPVMDASGEGLISANFGDCNAVVGNSAWMLWHARHTNHPEYAAFEIAQDKAAPSAFDLLWYANPGRPPQPPLASAFGSVITMRTAFDDPNATFLALRVGSTADNHTHLDLGSFVLDMAGARFAADLGPDNYDLPGYLTKRRAEYLRSSTPGHNTLSIGEASQPLDATARGTLTPDGRGGATARIDLSHAYPDCRDGTRTATLNPDGSVTIRDEFRFADRTPLTWNLHTPARVTPDGHGGAVLDVNGRRVQMRVLEPTDARLRVEADDTQPPAKPVEGVSHVRLTAPAGKSAKFVVQFLPLR